MSLSEDDEDLCQRCGDRGEDRRTIWMSCFYDMNELGLPLDEVQITGVYGKKTGERVVPGELKLVAPVFTDTGSPPREYRFFVLRVCKNCRAEWLLAKRSWFQEKGSHALKSEAEAKVQPGMVEFDGTVPIRVFGATVCVPKASKEDS